MKKTLAILLAFILTFSCFAILGIGTAMAETASDGVLINMNANDLTNWTKNANTSVIDENGDGVMDFVRLDSTNGNAALTTPTTVLVPNKEYKISYDIRVPDIEVDFTNYDGKNSKTSPRFGIFQPNNTAVGEKCNGSYSEGKNNYAYPYAQYGTVRRKTFSANWQVGNYGATTVTGFSGFDRNYIYNALKDASGNVISPNVAFKEWTTITATFTAVDDETNIGDQIVAINFSTESRAANSGIKYDIKNVKVIDTAAAKAASGIIIDEGFEEITDATTVIKDGRNVNWEKVEITDTEAANGTKSASVFAPWLYMYIPLDKGLLKANTEYKLSMNWKMLEYNEETAKNTLQTLSLVGWNPSEGQTVNQATSLAKKSYINATGQWINTTFNFTISDLEAYEEFVIYFYYSATPAANNQYTAPEDSIFIDDIKVVEASKEVEPEEPAALRGPEVDEGFEDFAAGTKLFDCSLSGDQNMYVYSAKGVKATKWFDLIVSNQGGYNGSKQSLMGKTYYQYAAMPLALDKNTEYELSFWYSYFTTNADVYLKEIFYGIVKPEAGKTITESIFYNGGGTLKMTENFVPGELESGEWRKATLKFSTGDIVDGLVFAYSYADGLKSDFTATVNSTPLYIDDVKIKKVENAPEKANITIENKDAASVEIRSGYFKDFVVGEKIQFKVRTKDDLVPTVTVNGTEVTANNGYYTYTITEKNVAIKVVCDGDENRGDPNNYNGLPLYEYNQDVAVTPIWEGNVVYHETALFTTGRETAKLLYPIDKVVAVRSYDLTKNYLEGVDYEIAEDGTLRILEGSQIPVYTGALEQSTASSFAIVGKENTYAKFVGDYVYPAYAITVTYEHSEEWDADEGYNPEAVQPIVDKVPNLIEKLEKGEDVEVVILGDSLSCGWSTSGLAYDDLYTDSGTQNINTLNFAPYTPAWPIMLEQTLKTLYPKANITFKNIAHGGKTAKWGSEKLLTRLGYLERDFGWTYETPDLLILAYGGNDMTAKFTPDEFKGYMQSIITKYRDYKQDESAEILLWTETRHHTQVTQYAKENHDAYQQVNYELADENGSIGVVDTLNVFNEVVQSKPETDIFNDCVIHINDFATRVIAQSFVAGLTKPKYLAGDINGDEVNNLKDLIVLAQYVAGWENLDVVEDILDVNLDGTVNLLDVTNLAEHLAGWKEITVNGDFYNEYLPVSHTLKEIENKLKLNSRATFDGDNLRMEWSYSGFEIQGQFSGDITLTNLTTTKELLLYAVLDGNYDNMVQLRIAKGTTTEFTILNNVKPGFHTVQLFKATEASAGVMTVGGIKYNGAIFTAPAEKELKIQFIGDSITSSSGLYKNDVEPDALLRNDISKGYAFKVAEHFDADMSVVSVSGGTVCARTPSLKDYYLKTFYSKDGAYDFSTETEPDLVVVALGTNDTGVYYQGDNVITDEEEATLKQGIKDMLTTVRTNNPNAKILYAYGMMDVRRSDIYKSAVEEFNTTDGNTFYTMIGRNDVTGSGGHPTPNGHSLNAKEYINFIENNIWVD